MQLIQLEFGCTGVLLDDIVELKESCAVSRRLDIVIVHELVNGETHHNSSPSSTAAGVERAEMAIRRAAAGREVGVNLGPSDRNVS